MTHQRTGLACALTLLFALGCALPAVARASDIIVQRDSGLTAGERAQVRSDAGVALERRLPLPDAELVTVPAGRERHALAALNADPDVRYAVPDVTVRAASDAALPSDAYFPRQWALDNPDNNPWYPTALGDSDIDAPQAWATSAKGSGVTVAVADMSVGVDHPDLHDHIAAHPQDFVQADECTAGPPVGAADHGTHVAGIVGALKDNGQGVSGVAPEATILPLRTLDNCGAGRLSWVIDAFKAAGGNPSVDIVTASFATDPLLPAAEAENLNTLFTDLLAQYPGTLFVVAAGNEGNDNDALPVYPCSAPADNLICVGMSDMRDSAVCWGNVGSNSVDLFAPGVAIYSTVRGFPGYAQLSGTSMSAPMVAGSAALVMQANPDFGPAEVKDRLVETVDAKIGMGGPAWAPHGRLNAARALQPPRGVAPGGGPGTPWVSCDRDHDGVHDDVDQCPDTPGQGRDDGCPDSDGDGIRDIDDNCLSVSNPGQADADDDGIGDACDTTPRGDDLDGDTKAALDDSCPTQPALTADGCPLPVVTPPGSGSGPTPAPTPIATVTPTPAPPANRIVKLGVTVQPRKCAPGRTCRKSAKVTVKLSKTAKVALKVEHRVRKNGRSLWERVTSRSITATATGRSLTVRGRGGRSLSSGPYRVTATIAGAMTQAHAFKV